MSSITDGKLLSILEHIASDTHSEMTSDTDNTYLKKQSQEFLLTEMEQKLEMAEINFGTLKQQLDYMKMLYHDVHKESDKLDKHMEDHHKKRNQSKTKNKGFSKSSSLTRRFSNASLQKSKSTMSKHLSSLGTNVFPHYTGVSNAQENNIISKSESIRNKSLQNVNYRANEDIASLSTSFEISDKEMQSLPELSSRPATEHSKEQQNNEQNKKVCNQEQQTDPFKVPNADNVVQDILNGLTEGANKILQQYVPMNEECNEITNKQIDFSKQHVFKHKDNEDEEEQSIRLISGNSRTSTNYSKASGKKYKFPTDLSPGVPKKGVRKSKSQSKKSGSVSTILTNSLVESFDTIHKHKRKPKFLGKNTENKRRKAGYSSKTNIQVIHTKSKTAENVISLITKANNKRNTKIKGCSSKSTICNKKYKKKHFYNIPLVDQTEFSIQYSRNDIPCHIRQNNNLVELYHNENMNVNISEENVHNSSSCVPKSNAANQNDHHCNRPSKSSRKTGDCKRLNVSMSKKECDNLKSDQNESVQSETTKPVDTAITTAASIQEEKKTLKSHKVTKKLPSSNDFEQPTPSSKIKYFKKKYYKKLNFRNIPFVAGTSTSPSHNLGLNIQQVLSIIKMKQPRFKENITSNAHSMDSPAFIHHSVHRRSRAMCPARIHDLLTDGAEKDDPSDAYSGVTKAHDSSASSSKMSNGIFFGLTNREKRPEDIWIVDQDDSPNKKPRCTCLPSRHCINYQQLLIEYLEKGGGDISFLSNKYAGEADTYSPYAGRRFHSHFSTVSKYHESKGVHQDISEVMDRSWLMEQGTINNSSINNKKFGIIQLQEKKYNLKGVLTHLHDDFNRLNIQYEELHTGLSKYSLNEEKMLEIEKLEAELQAKEDEINMVMDLHKEVATLKQQVKALRVHTSHSVFSANNSTQMKTTQYFGRGSTPSVRLTKLLRIIQEFQYRLRQVNNKNSKSLCFYHCFMINVERLT